MEMVAKKIKSSFTQSMRTLKRICIYTRDYLRIRGGLKSPSELTFFVSDRCNARCSHCFWRKKEQVDELSLNEIEEIVSSIKRPLSCLRLTGGEPFLRDDLAEVCEIFITKNKTRSININTNGLLVDRIITTTEEILKKNIPLSLQVSMDGMERTHDKIRGIQGAFKKASETVYRLEELAKDHSDLKIAVLTVISNQNYNEVEDLLEYSQKELKIRHHFELIRGTKFLNEKWLIEDYNPQSNDFAPPSNLALENIYRRIEEIYKNKMVLKSLKYQIKVLKEQKKIVNCLAGNFIGVIYSNGDVAICEMTKSIGNLRNENYDFEKIWHSSEANKRRRQIINCYCNHGCFFQPSLYFSLKYRLKGYNFYRKL